MCNSFALLIKCTVFYSHSIFIETTTCMVVSSLVVSTQKACKNTCTDRHPAIQTDRHRTTAKIQMIFYDHECLFKVAEGQFRSR